MRNTKSAFTLVELIVVITILAILGTIAFISLQGYSADARNSKRTSDVGNIQSAVILKQVEGVPLMSFITTDSATTLSGIVVGGTGVTSTYDAGTPAYTVLNVVEKDFKDPQGDNAYRIGASTDAGGVFQVAATMEIDGTDTALVNGTFIARATTAKTPASYNGKVVTLADTDANFFKKGDTVTTGSGTDKIAKVSRDGVTLTLTTNSIVSGNIALQTAESAGLIADKLVSTGAVEHDLSTYLPY